MRRFIVKFTALTALCSASAAWASLDWIYFNSTNVGYPTNEVVPGLGTTKFFEYNHASNAPSYVHVITPVSGVSTVAVRFYFQNGGGDVVRYATPYSNVVISSGAPFHGLPVADSITVTVWRAEFYPPSGWNDNMWFAPRVVTDADGLFWLVNNLDGAGPGTPVTNNFPVNPQLLYDAANGYENRDWYFHPTSAIQRASLNLDWAYFGSTNLHPMTEWLPSFNLPFVSVDYANTTTTFRVVTDTSLNLVPGETAQVQMQLAWFNSESNAFVTETPSMTAYTNLVITSGFPFHGLPAASSHTVTIWKLDWRQPVSTNGTPFPGPTTVYYAPLLKTLFGTDNYQTDYRYLLARIEGETNGWGHNNYTNNLQYFGYVAPGGHDYSLVNRPVNLDWFYFNNPAPGTTTPQSEFVPGLGVKFIEYNYGFNQPSYVHILAPLTGVSSINVRIYYQNGPGEITYAATFFTNTVINPFPQFHGIPTVADPFAKTVAVWRAAFYPPPAPWFDNIFYGPQVTLTNGASFWLVDTLDGAEGEQAEVNDWPVYPQMFLAGAGGFYNRDWFFAPSSSVTRDGIQTNWLYYNYTSIDPQAEDVPGYGHKFLELDYAHTQTVFHVLTDSPLNAVPGETPVMEMRIAYPLTPPSSDYTEIYTTMVKVASVVLDSVTNVFHELPASGKHTVDVWRGTWNQPTTNGGPVFASMSVYYAPHIKTSMGSPPYPTDDRFLVTQIEGATNGWGANNFDASPQFYGTQAYNHDYLYINQWSALSDLDQDGVADSWEYANFGNATNGATGDGDSDGFNNREEYIADTSPTNDTSYFADATNAPGQAVMNITINPTSTSRVYGAYWSTNLTDNGGWQPYGAGVPGNGGALTITVTNDTGMRHYRTGVTLP